MRRLLTLTSLIILLYSHTLTAQYFKTTPLQGLPKRYQTRPTRVSDSGMITGSCLVANGFPHACVWSPDGTVQDVGTLGGSESFGSAVNDQQQVVGYSFLAGDKQRVAFIWTAADGLTVVPSIGSGDSFAADINNSGQVVGGWCCNPGYRAFLWTQTTGFQDLGTLPGNVTGLTASAINEAGHVLGNVSFADGTSQSFLWTVETGMQPYGPAPSPEPYEAVAINNSDQIVADFNYYSTNPQGFLWSETTGVQLLEGSTGSVATGINDAGLVVGANISTGGERAALWLNNGTSIDLTGVVSSSWLHPPVLGSAGGINSSGQITVWKFSQAGRFLGGALLTPKTQTTLASSQNPSSAGQAVTFTATVTSFTGPPLDGQIVTFMRGSIVLGTEAVVHGVASFTMTPPKKGILWIHAVYAGGVNDVRSTSNSVEQLVQ